MGPGNLEHGTKISDIGSLDKNSWRLESERPSGIELPQLENYDNLSTENMEGYSFKDSERETVELPQIEGDNPYCSNYEERLKQTPRESSERGEWSGHRGESEFTPRDREVQDILDKYEKESIEYENAIPDFSEVSESTVEIEDMTENRAENFRQCDEKCAEQWNMEKYEGKDDWTPRDVSQWRKENGYSWHERNDMKTCDLIPTKVNDYFGHLGGVSECRKRDAGNAGGDFDE